MTDPEKKKKKKEKKSKIEKRESALQRGKVPNESRETIIRRWIRYEGAGRRRMARMATRSGSLDAMR
jgi:hypothetical protein